MIKLGEMIKTVDHDGRGIRRFFDFEKDQPTTASLSTPLEQLLMTAMVQGYQSIENREQQIAGVINELETARGQLDAAIRALYRLKLKHSPDDRARLNAEKRQQKMTKKSRKKKESSPALAVEKDAPVVREAKRVEEVE